MNNIKQRMNFLIACHPICSYLILPNKLELLLTQRLSLIIFFPIISQDIVSGNLTATISDHLPQLLIAPHIFQMFKCFQTGKATYLNMIGQNSIMENSWLATHIKTSEQ